MGSEPVGNLLWRLGVPTVIAQLVNMLYNVQLMQYVGEDGIAAYGVIMYVNFIFIAIFIGYSIGSAPVVGYHHGAGNSTELKSLFRKTNFRLSVTFADRNCHGLMHRERDCRCRRKH